MMNAIMYGAILGMICGVVWVFDEICSRTQKAIKNYTGLDVVEINLNINDVLTKKEWEQQSTRKKDDIANTVNDDRVE